MLQLTHRDVVLDFFKDKKAQLLRLHSGSPLELDREYLTAWMDGKPFRVAKLSKACVSKLDELRGKGYRPDFSVQEKPAAALSRMFQKGGKS